MIGIQSNLNRPRNPPRGPRRRISPNRKPRLIRSLLNGAEIGDRFEIGGSGSRMCHWRQWYV